MKRFFASLLLLLFVTQASFGLKPPTRPDEGMWIPVWIEELNYPEMARLGIKLSAEEVYSNTQPSIKDAIVGLVCLYSKSWFFLFRSSSITTRDGIYKSSLRI